MAPELSCICLALRAGSRPLFAVNAHALPEVLFVKGVVHGSPPQSGSRSVGHTSSLASQPEVEQGTTHSVLKYTSDHPLRSESELLQLHMPVSPLGAECGQT